MVAFLLQVAFAVATIGLMLAGLLALGNILPTATIASAITSAGSYLAVIYEIVPATTLALLAIFGTMLLIEFYVSTYKLIKWLYTKLPGIT